MSLVNPQNCTAAAAPKSVPSNSGVAGTGILLSFMITALLSIILSSSVIWSEFRRQPTVIRRKVLNGYSDSQIMQGICIQSIGLAQMDSLVPYHFFLIWMLSLLSMATHNATLLALVNDFRRDWVVRWMRQFLMFVNLALSSVSGVFVLETVSKNLPATLPIGCVWETNGSGSASDATISYIGTIVVIAGNILIFLLATWYLHSRTQKFYKVVQIAGMLLMLAIAVGAAIRIILLSQAFGHPSVKLSDRGETQWTFGQLLSMSLLVLPLVSAVEIYRGEIKVAPPVDDEKKPLYDGELQANPTSHSTFPPNPMIGSQTNLVQK